MQLRMLRIAVVVFFSCHCAATAQAQSYAGVLGGVSTLSGDARSLLSPSSTAFSSYDPKNGGAVQVVAGRHFSSGNKNQYTAECDRRRPRLFP